MRWEAAVDLAEHDPAVKVIVLRGAGRAFCAGYNFGGGFAHWDESMNTTDGTWDPGKDFAFTRPNPVVPVAGQKLIENQAYENTGLPSTQTLGAVLDGPWGDYSQAPPQRRPDPSHVIQP